jgi:uncharacterized protein YmfQ (DUF2313 family)
VAHSASDYKFRLAGMLPKGIDWLRVDPRVARLLAGLGRVGAHHEASAIAPLAEAPAPTASTGDTLALWEEALSLPDGERPTVNPDDVAACQAEVGRVLASGGTSTLAVYVAQAAVWGLAATATEYDTFPCEVFVRGPVEQVKAFRFGTSMFGDKFLSTTPETWDHVVALLERIRPGHVRVHTEDTVGS